MVQGGRVRGGVAVPVTVAALVTGLLSVAPAAHAVEPSCRALRWVETAPGSGVWAVPDAAHLRCLAARTDVPEPLGQSYLQTAPLDLTDSAPWQPIGTDAPDGGFWGAYDGADQPITGLVVDLKGDGDVAAGLFGVVDATGLLENVVVQDAAVRLAVSGAGTAAAGVLAGSSDGQIVSARASGSVDVTAPDGTARAGGLVGATGRGRASASVSGSGAAVGVTSAGRAAVAGGLVGYAGPQGAVIADGHAAGTVTATGAVRARAGGLLGEAAMGAGGAVTASAATGDVVATGGDRTDSRLPGGGSPVPDEISVAAGGLVGMAYLADGLVTGSSATGAVRADGPAAPRPATVDAGGLVGWNQSGVSQSFATGAVRATGSDTVRAGGLVGYHFAGAVTDTYATGSVTVAGSPAHAWAGGLLAVNGFGDGTQVRQSYAAGPVTAAEGTAARVGGLVGDHGTATVAASFWDRRGSGVDPVPPPDPAVVGTPAEPDRLVAAATYAAAGWSIGSGYPVPAGTTWGICDGVGRPFLAWQRFDANPCTGAPTPAAAEAVRAGEPAPRAESIAPAGAGAPGVSTEPAAPTEAVAPTGTAAPTEPAAASGPAVPREPSVPTDAPAAPTAADAPEDGPGGATPAAAARVVVDTPVDGSAVSSGGWFAVTARTSGVAAGSAAYVTLDGIAVANAAVDADGTARFARVPGRMGQYRVRIGPAPATVQSAAFALDVRPFAISYAATRDGDAVVTIRTGNWYRGQLLQLTRDGRTTATVRVGAPGVPVTLVVPGVAGEYQVKAESRQGTVYGMAAGALRLR